MRRLLVIGASDHGRSVLDVILRAGTMEVVGLIDDHRPLGSQLLGAEVLGSLRDLPAIAATTRADTVFVAIGDNYTRAQVSERVLDLMPGISFATVAHPSAMIGAETTVGIGTVVHASSTIGPCCALGASVIVNSGAIVEHDCVIADGASIAPGAALGGRCRIGKLSAIGIGAVVAHGITIGDFTVVGAGAVVVRDVPDGVVAYGNPARIVRERVASDSYL